MDNDIDTKIGELRAFLHAENDADLARKLRIDKSTVSSWRSRKRIPERFSSILDGDVIEHRSSPPELWGDIEDTAFSLALCRYTLAFKNIVDAGDYQEAMHTFRDNRRFWLIMNNAASSLQERMRDGSFDLSSAFAVLLHEDMKEPKAVSYTHLTLPTKAKV